MPLNDCLLRNVVVHRETTHNLHTRMGHGHFFVMATTVYRYTVEPALNDTPPPIAQKKYRSKQVFSVDRFSYINIGHVLEM